MFLDYTVGQTVDSELKKKIPDKEKVLQMIFKTIYNIRVIYVMYFTVVSLLVFVVTLI